LQVRGIGIRLWLTITALAVVAAAPAAAHADTYFISGQYPATLHGSVAQGAQNLTMEAGKVECAIAYHHEAKAISPSLPLAPTFTSCKGFGFLEATVHPNGCTFDLRFPGKTGEDSFTSLLDISCEAGKSIQLTVATCRVEIPAQSGLNSVALVNDTEATPKKDITFDPEVTTLSYKVTQDGFGCPFAGTGSKTGGTFTGSAATLTAQSPSSPETKLDLEIG
jgi:hypothetical protein